MAAAKGTEISLAEVREVLRAEVFAAEERLDTMVRAGTASDLMSDMLTGKTSGAVLLTGLCHVQVIRTAVIADLAGVILVRGKRPTVEMIEQARKHGLPLLSTPFTMFTSCGRLCAKGILGVEEKRPEPHLAP